MAVITVNHILGTDSNVVASTRPEWLDLERPHVDYIGEAYDKYGEVYGDVTETLPIDANGVSVPVNHLMGYEVLFYYRIRIDPVRIDFGNVLSPKTATLYVWNAYLSTQTLNSVVSNTLDGVSLIEPESAPTDFAGLEAREYTVQISNNGSPNVAGSYTFNFQGEQLTIPVTGQRVVVWPFRVRHGYADGWAWKTKVIEGKQREQRFSLRPIPWRRLVYDYWLDKQAFSRARAIAHDWTHRSFGVPIWPEGKRVGSLPAGSESIIIDTTKADFRTGGLALIWNTDQDYEAVEIDAVNSGSLDLVLPTAKTFSNPYVCPLQIGFTPSGIEINRTNHQRTGCTVEFLLTDNEDLSAASPFPQYRGYDVLNSKRVVLSDLSERLTRSKAELDNGNNMAVIPLQDYSRYGQTMTWSLHSQEDVWALTTWLHTIRGRQRPFWLPTWNRDLILAADIGASSLSITVQSIGYAQYYGTTDIYIKLKDGTEFYRRVSGGTPSGNNDVLSINGSLGQLVTVDEVRFISFLNLCRFDTDTISMAREGYRAQSSVPVITVNQDE